MGNIFQNIIKYFKRTKRGAISNDQVVYKNYSGLYNQDNIFTDDFFLNLIKTINWTEFLISEIRHETSVNYSTVLRTTNPEYEGKLLYRYENTRAGFAATPDVGFNYKEVLEKALRKRQNDRLTKHGSDQLGQVLEFDIDLTTHDGAPCAESEGFVDESDIPPIDTWFYLTKKYLYCWIPNMFIDKMQGAIDVEILDSYRWIKDSNPDLQAKIVERLKESYNK